jgi:ABC-type sulfate/molybdate transport systems ATPase subunit
MSGHEPTPGVRDASLRAELAVSRGGFTVALTLDVVPGRTLALVGPNGAGKSTALAALAGIVPSAGTITLAGRRIDGLPVESRQVGYVFQDYLLFPHLTILENVAFGPRASGTRRSEARASAGEWLERFGISHLASRRPAQLSGGQAQRVALARALAASPDLLLLDEPLAALDIEVRDDVRAELAGHLRRWGGLTIVVTHSLDDVVALADDVIVIENGCATQRAGVTALLEAPATDFARRLVLGGRG